MKKLPDAEQEKNGDPLALGARKTVESDGDADEIRLGTNGGAGKIGEADGGAGEIAENGGAENETGEKRRGEKPNRSKKIRALKTAAGALGAAACLFVAACFIVILVQLFSGKEPSLFGYRFYYILTDSMSPTYAPNDVVLSREFSDEASKRSIQVGDVVTFLGNTGSQSGKIITHRVVKAPYFDEASDRYFLATMGDKPGAPEDAPIPLENVRAAVVGKSRIVGFLFRAIRTPVGYVFLIVVPVCILIALLVLKLMFDIRKKKKEDAAVKERARLDRLKKEAVEEFLKDREKKE